MKVWSLGLVSKHWYTVFSHLFACCHFYYRITKSPFTIHITCILPSLRRTSAPIQLTIVLGVLGTQETSCILIAGLLERDIFDLYLPEFDKPWVTHLRENCRCPTNLCAWRPDKSTRIEACSRHQVWVNFCFLVCFALEVRSIGKFSLVFFYPIPMNQRGEQ